MKLTGEQPTAVRGSEEGGAKCISTVHTELLDQDLGDDEMMMGDDRMIRYAEDDVDQRVEK